MPKKQKSGLYRAKITIGTAPGGKTLHKYVSGKTKAELERNRAAAIAYYIKGEAGGSDALFGSYARKWYETYKLPNVSPATVASYRTALNKYLIPHFGYRNLRAITATDVQAFLNTLSGTNKTMISLCMAALKGIFSAAYTDRIIAQNPASFMIRPEAKTSAGRTALTPDQRAAVEAACPVHPYGRLLALLYYTGMRYGEVRGLMWKDIDFTRRRIHVERDIDTHTDAIGPVKTRNSVRYIPMPAPLFDILSPVRGLPDMFVIGDSSKHISSYFYDQQFTTLMRDLGFAVPVVRETQNYNHSVDGVTYDLTVTSHNFRHNFITMCWESGVDVYTTMRLAGHGDIHTTMNIYTHLTDAQLDVTATEIDNMFNRKVAQKLHENSHR